jgi:hypothetical protein
MPSPGEYIPDDVEEGPGDPDSAEPEAEAAISPSAELNDAKVNDDPVKQVAKLLPAW